MQETLVNSVFTPLDLQHLRSDEQARKEKHVNTIYIRISAHLSAYRKKASMIHRTTPTWQTLSWQEQLSSLITDVTQLIAQLELDPHCNQAKCVIDNAFPLRTTHSFVERMQKGDWNDPLLLQILPIKAENTLAEGFCNDPLSERTCNNNKGIIHKYFGRLLMVTTPQCAVNCRYCFRREFDYKSNTLSRKEWQQALEYIEATPSIDEVILSGGDPLVASDAQLNWLIRALENIPHVQRLRIHSRLPIVLPNRINHEFSRIFENTRLQLIMVTHTNHPNELDSTVHQALKRLTQTNFTLLNQAVLLKGINDKSEIQIELSKKLFKMGVLPYYLHLLDKIQGAAHFDCSVMEAKKLHDAMRSQLPGYLVPKLVREVAGANAKETIA